MTQMSKNLNYFGKNKISWIL